MPCFLTISIHDAELARICRQNGVKGVKVTKDRIKYSEDDDGFGFGILDDNPPNGGDLVEWFLCFIKTSELAEDAVCRLIRERSSLINCNLFLQELYIHTMIPRSMALLNTGKK